MHPGISVILVGNANVGKSVLFGVLAGRYVSVSNYPGTTVEVTRGTLGSNGGASARGTLGSNGGGAAARGTLGPRGGATSLVDTPGIQSLHAVSPDERVTRDVLFGSDVSAAVVVVDAKNLERGLMLAIETGEAGIPVVVDLNMYDEAESRGIAIDRELLSARLGVPVVRSVAHRREGIADLLGSLPGARPVRLRPSYPTPVEEALEQIDGLLGQDVERRRSVALLLLSGDDELGPPDEATRARIAAIRDETGLRLGVPPRSAIQRARLEAARSVAREAMDRETARADTLDRVSRWTVHPVWGWPILAAILYAMYQFVGVLGASVFVDFLEERVFSEWINPLVAQAAARWIPFEIVTDFLVGEYGILTVALTYSIAIVLPIVFTFFLAFSVLEDSGYLPRLALMLDRAFRRMGLNGKAVLPMVLGLGCDTMATMTTRILETRKDRIQVTLLLALGVPCSAQLGVILGMIAGLSSGAVLVWLAVISATLFAVGALSARLLPGESSDFILEIPPLRRPQLRNITIKTVARVEWYVREVIPVFVIGTAVLFALTRLDLLASIELALAPVVTGWLGLPADVTDALLVGFLRRDYGAAGLFAVARSGGMDAIQITVSLVVVTLFMPCIANLLMIIKEYGGRVAAAVAATVFPLAIVIGGLVRLLLEFLWS